RDPARRSLVAMNLIVEFDQSELGLVSLVGGKGGNLIALTAAGFPVPPGFVITSEAYRQFLATVPELEDSLAVFDYEHPEVLRQQCDRLRERLSQVPLPKEVPQAVHDGLNRLGATANDAF